MAMSDALSSEDSTELRLLVQRIKDLPTIPTILMKILSLTADSSANADNLAGIIGVDQTISAKLLRLSNSAFYGCRGKVTSISRAIIVLGFNEVKSLALGMSVFNAFAMTQGTKGEMSIEKLWKHSLATAALSRFLIKKTGDPKGEASFTAGLLHDIGKVVFLHSFREDYKRALALASGKKCSLFQAEEEVFKVPHTVIGEWLCRKWQLPEEITQCVRRHSHPEEAGEDYRALVFVVYLADVLARKAFVGYGGDEQVPEVRGDVLERMGLLPSDMEEADVFIEAEKANIEAMM